MLGAELRLDPSPGRRAWMLNRRRAGLIVAISSAGPDQQQVPWNDLRPSEGLARPAARRTGAALTFHSLVEGTTSASPAALDRSVPYG